MNIYKQILKNNILKLLTIYNLDPRSTTYGYGDRAFWGWKISDFSNGTLQGGVHSLAIALKLGLMENESFAIRIIDSAIKAVHRIRAKNGSMEEAYPNESSICVTSLVAFDLLSAVNHLESKINQNRKKEYLEIIAPLVDFISSNNEGHAVISNHIATSIAAIVMWNKLTSSNNLKYIKLLDLLYANQSDEGWYREYDGMDSGYQTLCTYYLFCAYFETQDDKLKQSLLKSAEFLKYFIHPDGTIGGLYGSRNTEVYYPAGIVGMANFSDSFALLAKHTQEGIARGSHVYPENIDIGNFIPLLNSYAVAALSYEEYGGKIENCFLKTPFESKFEKEFTDAGIFIKSNRQYYAIINYKKGGTVKVFDKNTRLIDCEDGGVFGELKNGKKFSTQRFDDKINFANKEIKCNFYFINEAYQSPQKSIILRILSLTFLRIAYINNLFKKYIVKMLMTGKKRIDGEVNRRFEFLEDKIRVHEVISTPKGCKGIGHYGKCKAIHMASSGYYLKQNEQMPKKARFVEFL